MSKTACYCIKFCDHCDRYFHEECGCACDRNWVEKLEEENENSNT